jgi:hypothetical protein
MTIHFLVTTLVAQNEHSPRNRIVISTGAQRSGEIRGFFCPLRLIFLKFDEERLIAFKAAGHRTKSDGCPSTFAKAYVRRK